MFGGEARAEREKIIRVTKVLEIYPSSLLEVSCHPHMFGEESENRARKKKQLNVLYIYPLTLLEIACQAKTNKLINMPTKLSAYQTSCALPCAAQFNYKICNGRINKNH